MTHKPRVIQATQTIRDVTEIFAKEEFHALPVVNEDGKIAGIVTTTDLIRYMLDQY
jgi:CBS-domain-containing membrane protein